MYSQAEDIKTLLDGAQTVVVLQADNPDADSLGSALALEHMLGDIGKNMYLYCGVDMPGYLHYLQGWDRVSRDLPKQFDACIMVDCSTMTLFEKLQNSGELGWVKSKPCIVIDHHGSVANEIDFATITLYDDKASSSSEVIYNLASQLSWPVSPEAGACLMTGILGDTQGLSNDLASAATYRTMAGLVEAGVDRPKLEEQRREYNRMPAEIFRYKAKLIERTEFVDDGRIAYVMVPQTEISTYSPLYNPVPLILGDILIVSGVAVAIVFKVYDDGKITGAIRANTGFAVADKIAEHLGGGGHPYASGFKQISARPFNELKSECIEFATELLNNLSADSGKEHSDETIQHTY